MNDIQPLANAAAMTLGIATLALILGLILAMLFAVWESSRWKLVSWFGTVWMTLVRGLPEILVVLPIYFGSSQLLLMLSDGFTLNLGLCRLPIQLTIDNLEISPVPVRCDRLGSTLFRLRVADATWCTQGGTTGAVGVRPGAGHQQDSSLLPLDHASDAASCTARPRQSVAGAVERYRAGFLNQRKRFDVAD